MATIFKKVKSWTGSIIVLLLMVVASSFVLTSAITGKASFFGKVMFMCVATDSMEPTLPVGSWIKAVPVSAEEVQVGDIIAYKAKAEYAFSPVIVHRVTEITPDGFVFQGDNNPEPDNQIVTAEQILYRITEP